LAGGKPQLHEDLVRLDVVLQHSFFGRDFPESCDVQHPESLDVNWPPQLVGLVVGMGVDCLDLVEFGEVKVEDVVNIFSLPPIDEVLKHQLHGWQGKFAGAAKP